MMDVSPTKLGMPAPKEIVLLSTRKFTLGKGLLNAAIVENILPTSPVSLHIRDLTVEERFMIVLNVGNPLAKGNTSLPIEKSTLEKSLLRARNVINLLPQRAN